MIRLVENIDIQSFIESDNSEANRRYWVFSAYNGPSYRMSSLEHLSAEEEDEYIEDCLCEGGNFIDIGKFDKVSCILDMDEWTSLNSFLSTPSKAHEIASYIADNDFAPESILNKYPECELVGFYWVDGWWELYGDLNLAYSMLRGSPIFIDTKASPFLCELHNEVEYSEARQSLQHAILEKSRA